MQLSPDSGKLILPLPTRHLSVVFDSTKLGRACSSDVYSILRAKAEVVFMTVYAVHINH